MKLMLNKCGLILAGLMAFSGVAIASEPYPTKAITIINTHSAGGPMDTVARLIAEGIREPLGVSVIVESKAGANGSIAAQYVAGSAPDGYTMLSTPISHVTNAVLNKNLRFDSYADFTPLAAVAVAPHALVVRKDFPAKDFKEFVELIRKSPNKYSHATPGAGGSPHLVAELFQLKTGTQLIHVPYKGAAPAVTDLIGGHVDMSFATLGSVRAQIEAGQLRALAVTPPNGTKLLPGVPSFTQLGVPDLTLDSWYGLLLPANTPADIVEKLHVEVAKVVKTPAYAERLATAGIEPIEDSNPEEFKKRIHDEIALIKDVAEKANISID